MIKTGKSHSFTGKTQPFYRKKASTPLLEVNYDSPMIKSTSLESVFNPLENEDILQKKTNPPEFQTMIEDDKVLLSEPIFNEICHEKNHSKGNQCIICKIKFGIFNNRKYCCFCGEAVCGDHSDKKRGNPKNTTDFVRICDICERKYLEKMIYQEFVLRKNKRNKAIFEMEQEFSKSKEEMHNKKKEIFSIMSEVFIDFSNSV